MNDYALYIGRFQPFHRGHLACVKYGFSVAKKIIIVVGGHYLAPSLTDPWTAQERKKLILSSFTKTERKRIQFIFLRDRLYNEELWKENLIRDVQLNTESNSKIVIIGHVKDQTSYYLNIFPQWKFIETGNFHNLNSTNFRMGYFSHQKPSYSAVPEQSIAFLKQFRRSKVFKTLQLEKECLQNHKQFLFVLLIVGNYLLLKKRSDSPGKNLYSLPDSLDVSIENKHHKKYFITKQSFYLSKYDGQNKKGKEVSFYFIANDKSFDLTKYTPTKNLKWMLLDDLALNECKMYADHYQIIRTLMQQNLRK